MPQGISVVFFCIFVLSDIPRLDTLHPHDLQHRIPAHLQTILVQAFVNSAIAIYLFELNMNFTDLNPKDMPSKT